MVGQLYLQNWISSGVWILTLKCSETSSFCSCVISPTVICFGRWSRDALSRVHTLVVLGRGLLLTGIPRPLPLTIPLPRPFVGGSNNPRDFAWEKSPQWIIFLVKRQLCWRAKYHNTKTSFKPQIRLHVGTSCFSSSTFFFSSVVSSPVFCCVIKSSSWSRIAFWACKNV